MNKVTIFECHHLKGLFTLYSGKLFVIKSFIQHENWLNLYFGITFCWQNWNFEIFFVMLELDTFVSQHQSHNRMKSNQSIITQASSYFVKLCIKSAGIQFHKLCLLKCFVCLIIVVIRRPICRLIALIALVKTMNRYFMILH